MMTDKRKSQPPEDDVILQPDSVHQAQRIHTVELAAHVAAVSSLTASIEITPAETDGITVAEDRDEQIIVGTGALEAGDASVSGVGTVRDAVPEEKAEPPRYAELVGWFLLPRQARDVMLGDWAEDYSRLLRKWGPFWAKAYCWWDVIRTILKAHIERIEILVKFWEWISRLGL